MDVEAMLGSLVQGALTGRKKRRRGAMRYLSGGKGSFLNASTLLALAGVAWGIYETVTASPRDVTAGPGPGPTSVPPRPLASPVPVPTTDATEPPADLVRVIRLVISAARADGALSPQEEQAILEQARAAGAGAIVERELQSTFSLASIVAGVTDPRQREELYTLAFAIVRADEQVTGGERVYLAQLAHQLGLDAAATARLEQQAVAGIERAAAESGDFQPS